MLREFTYFSVLCCEGEENKNEGCLNLGKEERKITVGKLFASRVSIQISNLNYLSHSVVGLFLFAWFFSLKDSSEN